MPAPRTVRAYIGVGANVGDAAATLALRALAEAYRSAEGAHAR